jgi:aminoglycoside 3'-phosphotransferase II
MSDAGGETLVRAMLDAAGITAEGLAGARLDHGMSGDLVFRIDAPVRAFAKLGDAARRISRETLAREIAVLAWLDGRLGAPRLLWSGEARGRPGLLMEALPGRPLHAVSGDEARDGAIAAIRALARLHALPSGDCPFDQRLERKLAESRLRIALGEVSAADFDPDNTGRTIADVWADVERLCPASEDLALTHGDASWPNFIIDGDRAGLIDLGGFGLADRYQDLAIFIRSGRRNAPYLDVPALVVEHYPLAALDPGKLEFYRILDEIF